MAAMACNGVALAQVLEVLHCRERQVVLRRVDSVLVEAMSVGTKASSQGMPWITASGQYFVVSPEVGAAIHLKGVVKHQGNLRDILLNTAQMRDAKCIQRFRIQAPTLFFTEVLEKAAANEWRAQQPSLDSGAPALQKPIPPTSQAFCPGQSPRPTTPNKPQSFGSPVPGPSFNPSLSPHCPPSNLLYSRPPDLYTSTYNLSSNPTPFLPTHCTDYEPCVPERPHQAQDIEALVSQSSAFSSQHPGQQCPRRFYSTYRTAPGPSMLYREVDYRDGVSPPQTGLSNASQAMGVGGIRSQLLPQDLNRGRSDVGNNNNDVHWRGGI
ncbi:hypothetical protein BDP27DRAFT_1433533 [Rhodocollybia butyracea]|uniref:Uncharacterized protein n=1 Tax=Rhodocollybia butyracea TaxID=206335 RepID=A0A9P5P3J9_9AGAR|nr:hypothetical protein BDP27DRAFT_1433533 [Rhodocollybia butyracea]